MIGSWILVLFCAFGGDAGNRDAEFLADSDAHFYWTASNCCGLVATYVVCQDLGHPVALHSLSRELPITGNGTSMSAMARCFDAHGLSCQGERLSAVSLYDIMESQPALRAVAAVGPGHWVVIGAAKNRRFAVYEYAKWAIVPIEEFEPHYKGVALMIGSDEQVAGALAGADVLKRRASIIICGLVFTLTGASLLYLSRKRASRQLAAVVYHM